MVEQILNFFSWIVITLIQTLYYFGILVLMALQSANIPIPSEIVLPFAGFLASRGSLNMVPIILFAVVGALIGGSVSFAIGKYLYPWIEIFSGGIGKLLISIEELILVRKWFERWGDWFVLVGTMLPIVRTYISLAAGAAGVRYKRFLIYSVIGNTIWSTILTWIGFKLGQNWGQVGPAFRQFDYLILVALIIVLGWLLYHRVRRLL